MIGSFNSISKTIYIHSIEDILTLLNLNEDASKKKKDFISLIRQKNPIY